MEGGRRFEPGWGSRTPETPEQQFRGSLRERLSRLRWESTGLSDLERSIIEKAVEKIDLKDELVEVQSQRDDTTRYQKLKQLGIFFVKDTTTQIDYEDPNTGFHIQPGDRVIDLHIPPLSPERRTLTAVNKSFEMIADYIDRQNLDPKYIVGVTYERLANVSRRQGFTVIEPVIPDRLRAGVENVYKKFVESSGQTKPMGKILLCYQPTSQFMERYLKSN